MPDESPPDPRAAGALHALANEIREARAALAEAIEDLSETRVYAKTERAGWTLKHELSRLAAADAQLLDRLARLRGDAGRSVHERRLVGEAMWQAQELRLHALRDLLAARADEVTRALEAHAEHLDQLEDEVRAEVAHLAREGAERARQAREAIRGALGR